MLTSGIRAVDSGEKPQEMPRRGETSIQSERASTDVSIKKMEVIVPTPLTQLSATNYRHSAMRMEVHLDAQGLWEAVTVTETNRQKDRLALPAMLAAIPESSGVQLDIKKSAKFNWEIIRSFHVGIDCLAQSRAQGLRREFENLSMKKLTRLVISLIGSKESYSSYDNSVRGLMTKMLSRSCYDRCLQGMTR